MKPIEELIWFSHKNRWLLDTHDLPEHFTPLHEGIKLGNRAKYVAGNGIYFTATDEASAIIEARRILDFLNSDVLKCMVRYDKQVNEPCIFFARDKRHIYHDCWCKSEGHNDCTVQYLYSCRVLPEAESLELMADYEKRFNVPNYERRNLKLRRVKAFILGE